MEHQQRVLIVDDEPENLRAITRELYRWARERGLQIDRCESGEAAMGRLRRNNYAVLLSDNRMPGMNGTELLRIAGHISPATVRIMLTGYTEKRDVAAALGAGVFAFLVKPWDPDELRGQLERALAVHERRVAQGARRAQTGDDNAVLVAEIRRRLMTSTVAPKNTGIVPSYAFHPAATGAFGSNYVDMIPGPDGEYAMMVGHVSGSGPRATLVASLIKAVLVPEYLRTNTWVNNPASLLSWLNTELCTVTEQYLDVYVSLGIAVVDPATRSVLYASAGNPLPLHRNGSGIELVEAYGIALGINRTAVYSDVSIELGSSDALILCSDGARLAGSGLDRSESDAVSQAIIESGPTASADVILDRFLSIVGEDGIAADVTVAQLRAS